MVILLCGCTQSQNSLSSEPTQSSPVNQKGYHPRDEVPIESDVSQPHSSLHESIVINNNSSLMNFSENNLQILEFKLINESNLFILAKNEIAYRLNIINPVKKEILFKHDLDFLPTMKFYNNIFIFMRLIWRLN